MRILMIVGFPHETFNAAVRDGSVGSKMKKVLDALKPETVYFTELKGRRTAIILVDLEGPSMVPALAEPWFLTFNADVEFHVVMSPEELEKAAWRNWAAHGVDCILALSALMMGREKGLRVLVIENVADPV